MNEEDRFHLQLARTIQSWLGVETELYLLYAVLMSGANGHLVSATFNHIQSVDTKLGLLNSCFSLVFSEDAEQFKTWGVIRRKLEKLNKKRNKIVHEPVSTAVSDGEMSISIQPSFLSSLPLVKGQTTHKRRDAVVSADYKAQEAQLLVDHRLDFRGLLGVQQSFEAAFTELADFRRDVSLAIEIALQAAKKGRAVTCR